MKIVREFHPADRYLYDAGACSIRKGYAQVDTASDAHYFGIWANPTKKVIFQYIEGDCITTFCKSKGEFVREILQIKEFYGDEFKGIDPGFNKGLKQSFVDLGLENLLH